MANFDPGAMNNIAIMQALQDALNPQGPQAPDVVEPGQPSTLQSILGGIGSGLGSFAGVVSGQQGPDPLGDIFRREQAKANAMNRANEFRFRSETSAAQFNQRRQDALDAEKRSVQRGLDAEGRAKAEAEAAAAAEAAKKQREDIASAIKWAESNGLDTSDVPVDATPTEVWRSIGDQIRAQPAPEKELTAGEISRFDANEQTLFEILTEIERGVGAIEEEEDPLQIRKNFEIQVRRLVGRDRERFARVMEEFESIVGVAIEKEMRRRAKADQPDPNQMTSDERRRQNRRERGFSEEGPLPLGQFFRTFLPPPAETQEAIDAQKLRALLGEASGGGQTKF